ncbi:hypothetical protein A3L04_04935 [Thermococcus chitonophagus]|uniref:Uncharacterized protein n=1 Tax=Thermococcus chitonophagus TaxID=54262 RepID=A0A160VUL4_9EURY|nr:hypothetical protein [Thermococcus chitonophagus]ASJ16465.1 hypothetical protein A3L04_04935 [Thermococcus chitonophagus]CUX78539.1 hypothetical protein CHITON_1760 [Thermococcus chitonophagus]
MKLAGLGVYLLGIALSVVRPPLERLACINMTTGQVMTRINPFFLVLELGLIMIGALFIALNYEFKNYHERNGWLAVSTGLGFAFIGGYSKIYELFLFGVVLATLGIIVYKIGRAKYGGS